MLDKILPHSIAAEMSVLGSILLSKEAIYETIETISPDDFYKETHRQIYSAMVELFRDEQPTNDIVILTEKLQKNGKIEQVGGAGYLATILNSVPIAINIKHYVEIIKEKGLLRTLIQNANKIIQMGYAGGNTEEIVAMAESTLFQTLNKKKIESIKLSKLLHDTFEDIEKMQKQRGIDISTGFRDLDYLTGGLHKSELLVLAGKPGHGKTSLVLNIAVHVAKQRKKVLYFSIEMSRENVAHRMICSKARVSLQKMRGGFLGEADWPKLTTAAGILHELPISVNDDSSPTAMMVLSIARREKLREGVDLVIIDYLQEMAHFDGNPRVQQVSSDVRIIRNIARSLDVPVILISSLRRTHTEDKEPTLSDLRESGEIEFAADTVGFVHRPEVYKRTDQNEGLAHIIIAKQRNGPLGRIRLVFQKEYTQFEDFSTNTEPQGRELAYKD